MKTIVYKVVRMYPGELMLSAIAFIDSKLRTVYSIGQETVAPKGKLFVFKRLEAAVFFADGIANRAIHLRIIECETDCEPVLIKKALPTNILYFNYAVNYWNNVFNSTLRLCPPGSYGVERLTPIRIL
jgi:hypothetical protein